VFCYPSSTFSNFTSSTFVICGKRKATIDTRIIITPATKLIMEIAPPLPCPNIEEIFPGFSKVGVRILSTIGPEVAIGITLIDSEMTLLAEKTLTCVRGDVVESSRAEREISSFNSLFKSDFFLSVKIIF